MEATKKKPGRKPKKSWWSVLLMRPDYLCSDNTDPCNMYFDHALAVAPIEAATIVRAKAVKADDPDAYTAKGSVRETGLDYVVLLIVKGRLTDRSTS